MKIEFDLTEILTDEFGDNQSLAETIKNEIVKNLTETIKKGINEKITVEIAKLIDSEIKLVVAAQMPSLITELIDKEYTIVDKWGNQIKEKTTIRNQLIKTLTEQMVYVQKNYNSEKNYFTKNIDAILETKINEFKTAFNAKVDEIFVKEAMNYAIEKLKKTLNLK